MLSITPVTIADDHAQHTTFKRTHISIMHTWLYIAFFCLILSMQSVLVLLVPAILLHACVHRQHTTITIAHTVSNDFETAT